MYGIFTYMSIKYMANVGQYSSSMEHLGLETSQKFTSMMMGGSVLNLYQTGGVLPGIYWSSLGFCLINRPYQLRFVLLGDVFC